MYKNLKMKIVKRLEYWWRHHIVYPVLKWVFRNSEIKTPIDLRAINSILILRYDRIGDMIVTTPVFKGLKDANPHLRIGVLASRRNAQIISFNPYIDKIHILPAHWWQVVREIFRVRKEHYDVILNLIFNRTTSGGVLSNLIAPNGIKIGQGDEKYRFYFNILLKLTRQSNHMTATLASIIKTVFDLQINKDQLTYDIIVDDKTKEIIRAYLTKHNLRMRSASGNNGIPYIVFNLSANDSVRRISAEQALLIGEHLDSKTSYRTILIHAPNDSIMQEIKQQLAKKTRCLPFPEQGNASLLEVASLIEGASVVITPDTSIIHFASAAQTPIIGFYTSMQDAHEWLPMQVKQKIILSVKDQPTSSIPISSMIEGIDEFLQTL